MRIFSLNAVKYIILLITFYKYHASYVYVATARTDSIYALSIKCVLKSMPVKYTSKRANKGSAYSKGPSKMAFLSFSFSNCVRTTTLSLSLSTPSALNTADSLDETKSKSSKIS